MDTTERRLRTKRWPWFILFVAIAAVFVVLGYLYYRVEVLAVRKQAHDQLHAVAMLKTNQIEEWRRERIAGLRMLVGSPFFLKAVEEFSRHPGSETLKSDIRRRLESIRFAYRYHDAILLNTNLEIILSLKQDPHLLDAEARRTVEDALNNNRISFGDFYRCSICSGIHIDIAAPLIDEQSHPIAVVVFRIDPATELYPLIQSWPVASKTAETLLVRKQGDAVLFLNELRHVSGGALKLSIPMTDTRVAAVQAFGGEERFIEAKDYRGVDVFADAHLIPGSPWLILAKVDRDEILSELKYRAALAALFSIIFIVLTGAAIGFVFISRQRRMYRSLYVSERKRGEAKEEFRITLHSIGDAVITTDTKGRVRYMNPVAETLTGWTQSDALHRPLVEVFQIVNEETRSPVVNPVAEVLEKGLVVGLANHTLLISKQGIEFPIADSGAPIRGNQGNIIGVVLVFRDQTKDRNTQKALQHSKELAERYLDVSAQIVVSLDSNGNILMLNNSGRQLLGFEQGELLGKNWFETCVAEPARSEAYRMFGTMIRSDQEISRAIETAVVRKDGSERIILWHHTVLLSEEGVAVGVLCSGEDITDRKKADEEVRRARKDWEDIFQAIGHPTIIIDPNHGILNANVSVLRAADKSLDELRNMKCYEIFHKSQAPPPNCPATALMESGTAATVEMEMEALGGYFLVSCTPVLDETGNIGKIIHIATDITDRKRMEDEREALRAQLVQAQKMEAVGTLAGGLAHDFNNILQVTLGYAELLLMDKTFPESYRSQIRMISESSRRGSDLAKRLLVFSRKTKIELRPMDLNHCIVEARKLLERTIPKMISIELFLQENLPTINGDPVELEQVLMNLAINARDAMPGGGRFIIETHEVSLDEDYARTHFDCKPGRYVLWSLSDTGSGMDRATLSHIYEPFFTTKESGKGTGLGLSVVYGIVKQHGARVGCYSEPGKGTTFKVYFPISGASVEERLSDESTPPGGTETILLVDDEDAIRDLGTRLLTNAGYEVLVASNGKEALDVYKANEDRIALVVLDLIMPEMGGKDCLKELLHINSSVKVVVASGHSANGLSKDAIDFGARDFIQKPFELHRVLRQIRAVLDAPPE